MAQLKREALGNPIRIVLGAVNDKDLQQMLPLFPKEAVYYFAKPNLPRGLPAEDLQTAAAGFGLKGKSYSSVKEAYHSALADADSADFIYVGGSTFVVAEIL